jgi:prepilin peptidase dependent protein B
MKISKRELGLTLIELMIAMVIGLIIVASVIGLFISMMSSNTTNLNEIRLNQELRAAMSLMTRDIRRAGYNGGSAAVAGVSNPFSTDASSAGTASTALKIGAGNDDVMFAYDVDFDGVLDNGEVLGYQLASNTLQLCLADSVANCTTWQSLTDPDVVSITGLSFTETDASSAMAQFKQVTISLTGQWTKDSDFTRTVTETIKRRNDHFDSW